MVGLQPRRTFEIYGEPVALPVRIRRARTLLAVFAVPIRRTRQIIGYAGLDPLPILPGRAACALTLVDYLDGDLHAYREFGVGFLVRNDAGGGPAGALGNVRALVSGGGGMFIHRLPVTEEFSMAAGRVIWGFPKVLGDIELSGGAGSGRGVVRLGGDLLADLRVTRGVPVPGGGPASAIDVFTCVDATTRKVPWALDAGGARVRPGGASLLLGPHPWADELRSLGLPRRALATVTIDDLRMRFEAAESL